MTALSLANLGNGAFGGDLGQAATPGGRADAAGFRDALARREAEGVADPQKVAATVQPQAADPTRVAETGKVEGKDAVGAADRERTRRSLGLDGVTAPPAVTQGDTILGGIQKLRGVFDARHAHINDIMKSDAATTQGLMAMQMELAQYTVMVDVSSKLTGKASSSLDTLMKGQ